MPTSEVTLVLELDTTGFERAMRKAWRAIRDINEIYKDAIASMGRFTRSHVQGDLRARYGPRNCTANGLWQSDMCAGWLHDSCPATGVCDCTCHGGRLR